MGDDIVADDDASHVLFFWPSTVEEMIVACDAPSPKRITPTKSFFNDLCRRILALEQARRG